jgi:Na+/H+-dicarboxylate symporter
MTINMDGMAASLGVIAVFSANLYSVSITPALMFQFVFLGLVLSIGTAGIKSSGVVMSTVLLQTLNMPLTLIPILAAVWPVIDIGHTTANITGDLNTTAIIGSRLRQLDINIFNHRSSND